MLRIPAVPPPAEIVNTADLWKTVVAALIAGVGITSLFSVTVLSVGRAIDASRSDRDLPSGFWAPLAVLGLAAALATIVLGVVVMTHKS
jgi:hypothetical protein